MANDLNFIEKLTIEEFKDNNGGRPIRVLRNPKTSKLFFTCGSKTGAVAVKGVPEQPMMSLVETPDGERFWLLHEEGAGAEVVATF